ncbi:MAG: hypothetical protein WBQ26_14500 [Gemmatimonadaceae bacterium]|nr:hypothetical protein [Gemmatimonadaceae bacterium]
MLQRSLFTNTHGVVGARFFRAADRPVLRSARWAFVILAASIFSACSSLQTGGASFGSLRYSSIAPAAAFGPSTSFADRLASNSLAGAPLYAPNIAIGDSTLAATIIRMRKLSSAFDSAMTALERSGIPIVIGTERQLKDQLPPGYAQVTGWQALTAFYPLTPNNARGRHIEHIAVVVRLAGLESALREAGRTADDTAMFNRYLERVLGHEIYGHTMPQIAYGKTAPIVCDDPTSGADWYSACVMQRERHVAAQISASLGTYALVGTR